MANNGERRGVDANDYDLDGRRVDGRDDGPTGDDHLREIRTSGGRFRDTLRAYAWLAGQYSVTFLLGSAALLMSIVGFAVFGTLVLVPAFMTSNAFGLLLAAWMVATMFGVRAWMKNRMASKGVNVTSFPF